jgi:hypothetical protein
LVVRPIESGGYGLENLLSSLIAFRTLNDGNSIKCKSASGFIEQKVDHLIIEMFPKSFKVLDGAEYTIYITEKSMIHFGSGWPSEIEEESFSTTISIISDSQEEIAIFERTVKEKVKKDKQNTVYALTQTFDGMRLMPIGNITSPLIKENYGEDTLQNYSYVVQTFNSSNPQGRLVIVDGPPGVGKTYFVRGLINDLTSCMAVIIPSKFVSEIDGPSLIPLFVKHKRSGKNPIVMIIEDADTCLAPRGSDNISSISTLLNNTDGILGTILDLRVIATTNQPKLEFDNALMRPGRLCRNVSIGALGIEQANKIYERLTKNEGEKYDATQKQLILAEIYADAFGSGVGTEKVKERLGFM